MSSPSVDFQEKFHADVMLRGSVTSANEPRRLRKHRHCWASDTRA